MKIKSLERQINYSIRLSPELKTQLDYLAENTARTPADMVRWLIKRAYSEAIAK